MAVAYDDILTVSEVRESDLSASSAAADTNETSALEAAISDETSWIATQINATGGTPMIRRVQQGVRPYDWLRDEVTEDRRYRAWADDRPVVEVQSPSDVGIRFSDDTFTRDDTQAAVVEYFAGWVRSDQSLGDLPNGDGEVLDGLSETDLPTLPGDLRRVALLLVLYELGRIEHGVAVQQITQDIGQAGNVSVTAPDSGALRRFARDFLTDYVVPRP